VGDRAKSTNGDFLEARERERERERDFRSTEIIPSGHSNDPASISARRARNFASRIGADDAMLIKNYALPVCERHEWDSRVRTPNHVKIYGAVIVFASSRSGRSFQTARVSAKTSQDLRHKGRRPVLSSFFFFFKREGKFIPSSPAACHRRRIDGSLWGKGTLMKRSSCVSISILLSEVEKVR